MVWPCGECVAVSFLSDPRNYTDAIDGNACERTNCASSEGARLVYSVVVRFVIVNDIA